MIIILKKDGQIVTDEANPVDVKAMDNATMILADPQDGDSIVYDATAGMWKAGQGSGGGSFSPNITNPQDGDTLVYDASEEKWVNGSGGGILIVGMDMETGTLDKTWKEIFNALNSGYYVTVQVVETPNADVTQLHICKAVITGEDYIITGYEGTSIKEFLTDSENGYPVFDNK